MGRAWRHNAGQGLTRALGSAVHCGGMHQDLMEMDPKISQHEMVRKLLTRNKTDEAVEKELGTRASPPQPHALTSPPHHPRSSLTLPSRQPRVSLASASRHPRVSLMPRLRLVVHSLVVHSPVVAGIMYGTNGDLGGPAAEAARGPSTNEEIQRVAKIIGDAPTAEELRMFMSRDAILSTTGAAAAAADAPAPAPAPAPVVAPAA